MNVSDKYIMLQELEEALTYVRKLPLNSMDELPIQLNIMTYLSWMSDIIYHTSITPHAKAIEILTKS